MAWLILLLIDTTATSTQQFNSLTCLHQSEAFGPKRGIKSNIPFLWGSGSYFTWELESDHTIFCRTCRVNILHVHFVQFLVFCALQGRKQYFQRASCHLLSLYLSVTVSHLVPLPFFYMPSLIFSKPLPLSLLPLMFIMLHLWVCLCRIWACAR